MRNLNHGVTHAKDIAYIDVIFQHSLDGKVFTKLAEGEIVPSELALPVIVMLHRVRGRRPVNAAAVHKIRLCAPIGVPIGVRRSQHDGAPDRFLGCPRRYISVRTPIFLRLRDVHREQLHRIVSSDAVHTSTF
jgi:hypothetical protein